MKVEQFVKTIGADFFTGIPDSQLKALCDYLISTYGEDGKHHVIAANEGNCTAIAAGYHLATGRVPVVYLQNSGEGNIINPVASLCNEKVYGIPAVFVVGWRGEPGVPDEPQHAFQGEITLRLLETMQIPAFVVKQETTPDELEKTMLEFRTLLADGQQVAFVICKGALCYNEKTTYKNAYGMYREDAIRHILAVSGGDRIVSTTGKASRELFELREAAGQEHGCDFLTVGSMGHTSSIALGIALQRPEKKLWIIDGDGAMLMHMGALAVIGAYKPGNMVHIVINNAAHESVGGQPTVAGTLDIAQLAKSCGYPNAVSVDCFESLDAALNVAKASSELWLIEAKCAIGARTDLGRPTLSTKEIKTRFMEDD